MSFDLGNWAERLRCDMCTEGLGGGDDPDIDLDLDPDYDPDGGGLGDDFWDPPAPGDDGFEWPDPDYWPTYEGTDGGFIIGVGGRF